MIFALEMFEVHTARDRMFVNAHTAHVSAFGTLSFAVRRFFFFRHIFLSFAAGEWSVYHLANGYWHGDRGTFEIVKTGDVGRLVRSVPTSE
jgi:hypothetical protein